MFWWGRKGKRGRGAAGKVLVFGILKRENKAYTQLIEDTLMPIIPKKIRPYRIVYTDCYRSNNALDFLNSNIIENKANNDRFTCSNSYCRTKIICDNQETPKYRKNL